MFERGSKSLLNVVLSSVNKSGQRVYTNELDDFERDPNIFIKMYGPNNEIIFDCVLS